MPIQYSILLNYTINNFRKINRGGKPPRRGSKMTNFVTEAMEKMTEAVKKIDTDRNRQIAKIIMQQIGGHKFCCMVGAKNIYAIENGVVFKFMRNRSGFNYLRIKLNAMDTYDLEFLRYRAGKETKKEFKDIYCDQLEELFKDFTGLNTRLF